MSYIPNTPLLAAMIEAARRVDPKFSIAFKTDSTWMRFLGWLSRPFNPEFMTSYSTTVGSTVYFPSRDYVKQDERGAAEVLAHEIIHMADRKTTGMVLHGIAYLFPQILSAFALLSIVGIWEPWWLLNLVWLAFLAPIPAPWRREIEMHGYTMSLCMSYWMGERIDTTERLDFYTRQFTGSAYYWMWPFGAQVRADLLRVVQDIHTGDVYKDPTIAAIYSDIKTLLVRSHLRG